MRNVRVVATLIFPLFLHELERIVKVHIQNKASNKTASKHGVSKQNRAVRLTKYSTCKSNTKHLEVYQFLQH